MLWLQGWDQAPSVAKASRHSWIGRNPGWRVHALDRESLKLFIPGADCERVLGTLAPAEALSDLVRLELLHRYGGVWVDATTLCAEPLDRWLHQVTDHGFFAFDRPSAGRMIATWFLAAAKGSHIIERWRAGAADYWRERTEREDYYWPHRLFSELYAADLAFQALWDAVPKISARHLFHFGPESPVLYVPPSPEHWQFLRKLPAPVFKLTHKLTQPYGSDSLMEVLCRFGFAAPERGSYGVPKRILVGWYGSFAGHGTIGDIRAFECAVTHLVGRGYLVDHATAADLTMPGANRVDWQALDPAIYDGVLFVCGPILKSHRRTRAFFARFAGQNVAAVSVSMFPEGHPQRFDPFSLVLAREGSEQRFGDLAVAAPVDITLPRMRLSKRRVGLALRGAQREYGSERCVWQQAEAMAMAVAEVASSGDGEMVMIENHLTRSGLTAEEIEQQYASCDLIITSRFHGAICALRRRVPFIALDHIEGGAKVSNLLRGLGWPHVYRIDEADVSVLSRVAQDLLSGCDRQLLSAARDKAVGEANRTLAHLDRWAEKLPGTNERTRVA